MARCEAGETATHSAVRGSAAESAATEERGALLLEREQCLSVVLSLAQSRPELTRQRQATVPALVLWRESRRRVVEY